MYSEYIIQYIMYGILCYLVCNFNFAVLFSKHLKHIDIRTQGSGNPGSTNMFRVFGFRMGALTFLFDLTKGVVCAGLGLILFKIYANAEIARFAAYIGGLSAGVGHVFPFFYKFNGGKGVATGIGFLLVVNPVFTLIALASGVIILALIDRMSVFSILFYSAQVIQQGFKYLPEKYFIFIFVAAYFTLVVFAHRANILRLIMGKEQPLGLRKKIFKKR